MNLFMAEPRFFEQQVFAEPEGIDDSGLFALLEKCFESNRSTALLRVSFESKFRSEQASIEHIAIGEDTISESVDRSVAAKITLSVARILAESRVEKISDVPLEGSALVTLPDGKKTKVYVGSGMVIPDGYQILFRVLPSHAKKDDTDHCPKTSSEIKE